MISERLFGLLTAAWRSARDEYVAELSQSRTQLRRFAENEAMTWEKTWLSMPLRRRLWLWRRGFLSQADVFYDIDEDNYRQYFSDYQRERALWLNGDQRIALDNKLFFHWMMEPFDEHRVDTYGLLERGRFHDVRSLRPAADGGKQTIRAGVAENGRETMDAVEWVTERLREEGTLMTKPCRGGGGRNVMRWSFLDDTYRVGGEELSETEFESLVTDLDGYLVSEVVEQADYAAELFPDSANTMRLLTLYDDDADEPYLAAAVHRVGTERSAPVDNFSKGGLAAGVDRETGELTAAFQFPYSGILDWHHTHPDTGARIEGVGVPDWPTVRERVLDMAAAFSHTPQIGWDIVLTGQSEFTVIEANNSPNVRFFQVHRPLLADPRVRRFYEQHGIVSGD